MINVYSEIDNSLKNEQLFNYYYFLNFECPITITLAITVDYNNFFFLKFVFFNTKKTSIYTVNYFIR